jgi:hypothetical protein
MLATRFGVLHVGGAPRCVQGQAYTQYHFKQFSNEILKHAFDSGVTQLAVFVTENPKRTIPNSLLCGDLSDCLNYINYNVKPGTIPFPVYYYHFVPPNGTEARLRCFLDCEYYYDHNKSQVSSRRLANIIRVVNLALNTEESKQETFFACGSIRYVPKKSLYKHSFHVTWPNHTFATMEELKRFLSNTLGESDEYDFKVYTNGRLMRAPFFGKGHETETAILWPVIFDRTNTIMFDRNAPFDQEFFQNMDIMSRSSDTIHHNISTGPAQNVIHRAISMYQTSSRAGPLLDEAEDMLAFFNPIMFYVVSLIQQHRRKLKSRRTTCSVLCGVPVGDVTFTKPIFTGIAGTWLIHVHGDTFCEYDHPNYHHSTGDKINISINLSLGYYNQLCYACNPHGEEINRYSLFTANGFGISTYDPELCLDLLWLQGKYGVSLFSMSVKDSLLLHQGSELYVYDESVALWVTGNHAVNWISVQKNVYRERYQRYLEVAPQARVRAAVNAAESESAKNKILNEWRTRARTDPHKDMPGQLLVDSIIQNFGSVEATHVECNFDIYPHLVPFSDGTCFNVFTGTTVPRTKDMMITSCLNTVKKEIEDDECQEIREWFKEVSLHRPALGLYIQRIIGYSCTHLTGDRHFYVNLGIGSNGKGVLHRIIKQAFAAGPKTPARYCQLQENFFTAGANSRNASECATPSRMQMEHKTLYIVEELPSLKLATSLLKQISANDEVSGRCLFKGTRQFEMRGKLIINSNKCPNVSGEETAVWDRMVLIPWDTRYEQDDKQVDEQRGILKADPVKMTRIESLVSAFVTVCLNELHKFYRLTLQSDGTPKDLIIPRPIEVKELCKRKKYESFALLGFIENYLEQSAAEYAQAPVSAAHHCYLEYLKKENRAGRGEDRTTFVELLLKVGIETTDFNNLPVLKGYQFTKQGALLASTEFAFVRGDLPPEASVQYFNPVDRCGFPLENDDCVPCNYQPPSKKTRV